MRALSENRSSLRTEPQRQLFSQFDDTASLLLKGIVVAKGTIRVRLIDLSTDVSSVAVQVPSMLETTMGSSVTWQEHNPFDLIWLRKSRVSLGRVKLSQLKAKVFDPRTKQARVNQAVKLLSNLTPITGLDKATWKSIVEETALEDTYGD